MGSATAPLALTLSNLERSSLSVSYFIPYNLTKAVRAYMTIDDQYRKLYNVTIDDQYRKPYNESTATMSEFEFGFSDLESSRAYAFQALYISEN